MPKLVKGKAIRLHPLVTPAFNADFDGDQMAVHVPLSEEAVAESKILMIGSSNILGPKDGKPIVTPSQDMVLGNYYITREVKKGIGEGLIFANKDEVVLALDNNKVELHAIVAMATDSIAQKGFPSSGYIITTPGKIIFNAIFSPTFPFINSDADVSVLPANKDYFLPQGSNIKTAIAKHNLNEPFRKNTLSKIIALVFKKHSLSETSEVLDDLKDIGFKYSTISGTTVAISDIKVADYKYQLFKGAEEKIHQIKDVYRRGLLTNKERHNNVVKVWTEVKNKVQDNIAKKFMSHKSNPIFMMADSGARGNLSNFTQLVGMRGLMTSPYGDIIELPIKSSFIDGLNVSEFFISTHGARKGIADTAFKTGTSGYLTRILVDSAQDVIVLEKDCGSSKGFIVEEIKDTKTNTTIIPLESRLEGRIISNDIVDKKGNIIIKKMEMITEITLRALLPAELKKLKFAQ